MSDPQASLERLAAALSAEREALIAHDVDALMRSTRDKIVALRELETYPSGELSGPLAELAEFNRANGALLARRRREVTGPCATSDGWKAPRPTTPAVAPKPPAARASWRSPEPDGLESWTPVDGFTP